MDVLALRLGEEEFEKLLDERELDLFFWVGCAMHKELNSIVGGYAAASKYWKVNDLRNQLSSETKTMTL